METLISRVFRVSDSVPPRGRYKVLGHLVEEVGELSQEVVIKQGDSYKKEGVDGILGEAVDVILCALDLIRVDNPTITEEEITEVVVSKLLKWKNNTIKR